MEDEIIKKKLLIDGDGFGDDKRINFFIKNFLKWCDIRNEEEDENLNFDQEKLNYEKLLALVNQCEHAINKSSQIQKMNYCEMQNYENLSFLIENDIVETQVKIEKLKVDLEKAKTIKKNKLIYDDYAETIFKHPDRKKTLKLINQVDNETKRLKQIRATFEQNLEDKKKQFKQLSISINTLDLSLNDTTFDEAVREVQSYMDEDYYENFKLEKSETENGSNKDSSFVNNKTVENSNNQTEKMDTN